MAYTYIDLFCGAGGLSFGFDKAGFENVFAVELNSSFAKTYKRNFPGHDLIVDDIKNIDREMLKRLAKGREIDVIAGGPPCQGFSIAGNIGRSFIEDDRNSLFKEFVRVVSFLKPKMFIMENVASMATHLKGRTIETVVKAFEEAGKGYKVRWEILNSADYGIAQERRRILIVGIRKDCQTTFSFPPKARKIYSVKDAIGDLPPLKSGESSGIPNHVAMKHSDQMLKKMSYVKDGGDRRDIPEELRPRSGDVRKYIRYHSERPSVCVTGDMRKIFHYEQNRALTARELARLQSFEDTFIFEGTSIQIQQQIGNAVPPKLAYQIAVQAEESLKHVKLSKGKLHREQREVS